MPKLIHTTALFFALVAPAQSADQSPSPNQILAGKAV